jgi:hypothetical protein
MEDDAAMLKDKLPIVDRGYKSSDPSTPSTTIEGSSKGIAPAEKQGR